MAWLDLDELPQLVGRGMVMSDRLLSLCAFRTEDHLTGAAGNARTAVMREIMRLGGTDTDGPVRLLTQLRWFGHYFSPLNLYYVYDRGGTRVCQVLAEVNNTPWGERHLYLLSDANRVATGPGLRFRHTKQFHVSPFMGMDAQYHWRLSEPGETLRVALTNHDSDTGRFDACMTLLRRPLTRRAVVGLAARRPFATTRRSLIDRTARWLVLDRLRGIQHGGLRLVEPGEATLLGDSPPFADLLVRRPRFFRRVALGGALGAADAFVDGDWDSPDLTSVLQVLARNSIALQRVERGAPSLLRPIRAAFNRLRRNTLGGSRRNIAAHYDLSNDFFALMLDPTMTYSSGYFATPDASLEQASTEKYDRICRKLDLGPEHHVLEIGSGWGGFAEHAAGRYGCRVTTTTISDQQLVYVRNRISNAGLSDRITLLSQDYRSLEGAYDRLVSIEMIEAVGKEYLPGYFRKCSNLLKPDGAMALQAITIPDCRYEAYCRSVDFIQRYIFPGGSLPSPGAITGCLAGDTDFRLVHVEDFSDHYARTLAAWRDKLWGRVAEAELLGFDDRFLRIWRYYLCYCEAGFLERQVGVSQWVFNKPLNRTAAG
ncbi:unnamed protein product [Ostreobium quekettii]|uniref:Cyclopropane-fatty-acyl-phospholipid synthase n=1 Tax=Ostreobium quekettii TaxID=121088 RepID=A0A8S1IK12_9CHLO|nr:unnamed protein product [Ostreobium quekettii]